MNIQTPSECLNKHLQELPQIEEVNLKNDILNYFKISKKNWSSFLTQLDQAYKSKKSKNFPLITYIRKLNQEFKIPYRIFITCIKPTPQEILEEYMLVEICQNNQSEFQKLKNEILEYFRVENNRWGNFTQKLDVNKKENNKLATIRQLFLGFNIPYSIFIPFYSFSESDIITDRTNLSHLKRFVHLKHKEVDVDASLEFQQNYIESLEKYIKCIEKKFEVYDYLGKGSLKNPGHHLQSYLEANNSIFSTIEEQVRNNSSIQYNRILALPISIGKTLSEDFQAIAKLVIRNCSVPLYKHICRCLKKYPSQCKFHVVRIPTRTYHYGLIDDKYVLIEHYRYDRQEKVLPDLLFIKETSSSDIRKLNRIYSLEVKTLTREKTTSFINLEDVYANTVNAVSDLKLEKEQETDRNKKIELEEYFNLLNIKLDYFNNNFKT